MPERTVDLALTGRLLIWTIRHWGRARCRRRDLPGFVLHTVCQLPGGEAIMPTVDAWLAVLALGARQPLCFAAPEAPDLTRHERTLLLALLAAGCGLDDEIRPLLADLQDAGGLRCSAHATQALGRLLAGNGLTLAHGDASARATQTAPAHPASRFVHK